MIDDFGEELLYDFRKEFGLDLRDIFVPESGLSPSYCLALIKHLPLGSAFIAAKREIPESKGWGTNEYLMANLMDLVNNTTYVTVAANSKRKPKPPAPVYRPGDDQKSREKKTKNAFRAQYQMRREAALKAKQTG